MDIAKKTPILPARLAPGDTIGIVAPASPFDVKIFDRGIRTLKSLGFRVRIPDDLDKQDGYLAGSDGHRADIIHRLFADQTIKAIVCAKGGFGSMRLLPRLDYTLIEKNPKIFIGHSDISALLSAMYTRSGLVTLHGPVVTTMSNAPEKTKQAAMAAMCSDRCLEITCENGMTIRSGSVSGRVCGGNLTTLCHLLGTPFGPGFSDHILFLEDRGEAPYRIDRMLFQMKLAGCFQRLAGLILGDFIDCGSPEEIIRIFTNLFEDSAIPILAGFEAGHGKQNITLPLGLEATLDADNHRLSYLQPATVG
jgi:muramoyltetrapeptide carboxypeptidase